MLRAYFIGTYVLLYLSCCGCKGCAATKSVPDEQTPSDKKTLPDEKESAATKVDDIARNVVKQWLAAQNKSDFNEYKTLYAQQFEGIKRVGDKKKSYDRKRASAEAKFFSARLRSARLLCGIATV